MWGFRDLRDLVEGCGWGWTWTLTGKKLSIFKCGARSGLCAQMLNIRMEPAGRGDGVVVLKPWKSWHFAVARPLLGGGDVARFVGFCGCQQGE